MKTLFADRLTCALNLTLVEGEVGRGSASQLLQLINKDVVVLFLATFFFIFYNGKGAAFRKRRKEEEEEKLVCNFKELLKH